MAFSHSFSPDIYGDIYEPGEKSETPTTVSQALFSMPDEQWDEMARDVFGCTGNMLGIEEVYTKIIETDTVSDLSSPVSFWIDPEGFWTVEVYDEE